MTDSNENKATWTRALYLLLFILIFSIVELILYLTVIVQFILTRVTGSPNEKLLALGKNIALYLSQIALFFSFNSDDIPYPFSEWPSEDKSAVKKRSTRKAAPKKSAPKKKKD